FAERLVRDDLVVIDPAVHTRGKLRGRRTVKPILSVPKRVLEDESKFAIVPDVERVHLVEELVARIEPRLDVWGCAGRGTAACLRSALIRTNARCGRQHSD